MLQIRNNVFETNSSSVHSMVMCSENEYEAWVNGDVLFNVFHDDPWAWTHEGEKDGHYIAIRDEMPPVFVSPADAAKYDKNYPYPATYNNDIWGGLDLDFTDEEGHYHTRKFITFEEYNGSYGYDFTEFYDTYTSESGDKIVAFGYYGRD